MKVSDFWTPIQRIIEDICVAFDKKWQTRKRLIDTHLLVLFICKLVLSKNQQGYKSIIQELWEEPSLSKYKENPIASSSLCEARQKLPEEIFIELNKAILEHHEKNFSLHTWREHRLFAADGSKINLPHELLEAGYTAPSEGQYYPQGVMSTIYHLSSGLIYDCLLSADRSERHSLILQMDSLSEKDILVLERGYFSYLILYQAVKRGIHLICRLQSGSMNKAIETFWKSDSQDAVIDYSPSAAVKSEIKKQGYDLAYRAIQLRLIKYKINDEVYVCATTLIGEAYPNNEFSKLYHGRWGIEEMYKISKEFINIEDMHSKTERGVKQELYAHVLLINIARIFEIESEHQLPPSSHDTQEEDNAVKDSYWQNFCDKIKKYKVNFKNCLLVISRHIEKLLIDILNEKEDFIARILRSISNIRQKIRPGRHYPRHSEKPYTKWKSSNVAKLKRKAA